MCFVDASIKIELNGRKIETIQFTTLFRSARILIKRPEDLRRFAVTQTLAKLERNEIIVKMIIVIENNKENRVNK